MPPLYAIAYRFATMLPSVATPGTFQIHPTLAAGDVLVGVDSASLVAITTLPTVTTGSPVVWVDLSAAEMTGTNIVVYYHDVAGNEWLDGFTPLQTQRTTTDMIWDWLQQSSVRPDVFRPRQDPLRLRR